MPDKTAHISFVGAGPGRPDLLTLRGRDLLAQADVLLVDDLVHSECYLRWMQPRAAVIRCGKRAHRFCTSQHKIESRMRQALARGQRVVRLKGGDPLLFARLKEELDMVRRLGVAYEIVPGVTAASGSGAYAEWLLTEREEARAVTLLTATVADSDLDWQAAARLGRLVLYMGILHVKKNVARLLEQGLAPDTEAQVVRWGSRGWQQRISGSLDTIAAQVAQAGLRPPALLLIGKGSNSGASWYENLPLLGTTVLTFRPDQRGWQLAERLRSLGVEALNYPVRRAEAFSDGLERASAGKGLHLFTSVMAAQKAPAGGQAVAVGHKTGDVLRQRGLDVLAEGNAGVASLREALQQLKQDTSLITWHCGLPRRREGSTILAEMGYAVQVLPVYRTQAWLPALTALRSRLWRLPANAVFFFSSPELFRLVHPFLDEAEHTPRIWTIGETTAQVVRDAGRDVEHILARPDDEQLITDLLTRQGAIK